LHDEIGDRGLLYLKLERFSEAVDDLETYLRLAHRTPPTPMRYGNRL